MSKQKKGYFDELVDYALKKPNTTKVDSKYYVSVGTQDDSFIKLMIKRNVIIACFDNEENKVDIIKENKVSIKKQDTEIKVVDEKSLEAAKYMINVEFKRSNQRKSGKK